MKQKKDKSIEPEKVETEAEAQVEAQEIDPMTKLAGEYVELEDKYKRLQADYANYQKRVPKMISDEVNYKVEGFIKSLLPNLDNFEHAIKHSENSSDAATVVEGIKMVYDNILATLKTQGLDCIKANGVMFDPSIHQAVAFQSDDTQEDGFVLEELQKGYDIKGKVIRPAMVLVNKIEEPSQDIAQEQSQEQSQEQVDTEQ